MVLLSLLGIKVVLVHGGGPEINAMLAKTGKESKFVNGLRYTDEETIDIVQNNGDIPVVKRVADYFRVYGGYFAHKAKLGIQRFRFNHISIKPAGDLNNAY